MSLQIDLNKSEYYPGETVEGNVVITTETPIKAWKLMAWCIGKQHLKIVSEIKEKKQVKTYDGPFPHYIRVNQARLVWKSDGNEDIELGQNRFPFSF